MILIDTCIFIDCLRGREEAQAFLEGPQAETWVSVLTLAELAVGVRHEIDQAMVDAVTVDCRIVTLDAQTARLGGSLKRRYRPSHGTDLVDALLAAAAMRSGARLATVNRRHFPMLDDLIVPY